MSGVVLNEVRKLPIWRTVLSCTQLVLRHSVRLSYIGLPVIVLWGLLLQPSDAVMGGPIIVEPVEPMSLDHLRFQMTILLRTIGWWVLAAVVSTAALVSVHRLVLRGDRGPYRFLPYRIGFREGSFLLVLLVVWAPHALYEGATDLALFGALLTVMFPSGSGLVSEVGAIATLVAIVAGSIAVGWVTARLALALPLAAIDTGSALRGAWSLTRRNGWRVFAVLVLVSLPAVVFFAGLLLLDGLLTEWEALEPSISEVLFEKREVRPGWWYRTFAVGAGFVVWCMMLFEAVALSLIYRALAESDGRRTEPSANSPSGKA